MRQDIAELHDAIRTLRETDWQGSHVDTIADDVAARLDTILNCVSNLADELADVDARLKRLERAQ